MGYRVEQADGGNGGLAQGQDDPPQGLPLVGTIDAGGLHQLSGDGLEIGPHDNHVVDLHGPGDNHGPDGIIQPQLLHQQEGGNHTAAKEHGEGKVNGDGVAEGHFLPGHGVSRDDRKQDVHQGAQACVDHRVFQPLEHLAVPDDGFVGLGAEFHRQQSHIPSGEGIIAGKGHRENVQHRCQNGNQHHRAHEVKEKVEYFRGNGFVFNHCFAHLLTTGWSPRPVC